MYGCNESDGYRPVAVSPRYKRTESVRGGFNRLDEEQPKHSNGCSAAAVRVAAQLLVFLLLLLLLRVLCFGPVGRCIVR